MDSGAEPAHRGEGATRAGARITVEQRRLTRDERIHADLLDRIAQAPNLPGQVGVASHAAVVTLSGWTTTA